MSLLFSHLESQRRILFLCFSIHIRKIIFIIRISNIMHTKHAHIFNHNTCLISGLILSDYTNKPIIYVHTVLGSLFLIFFESSILYMVMLPLFFQVIWYFYFGHFSYIYFFSFWILYGSGRFSPHFSFIIFRCLDSLIFFWSRCWCMPSLSLFLLSSNSFLFCIFFLFLCLFIILITVQYGCWISVIS